MVSEETLQVNATDPDEGSSGQVTYSPSSGLVPTPSQFSIDPRTGILCVISRLDRDDGQDEYNFAVKATDGGGLMSHAFVQVVLEDINDNFPVFTSLNYRGHIEYDAAIGTEVKHVVAEDKDAGEFGRVTYAINPATNDGTFSINQTTGLITLIGSLNWVQHPVYNLEVIATDGGGLISANHAQVTITVAGPDTSPPEFESSSYTFAVQENAAQVLVGRVKATHVDPGITFPITYTLTSGDPNDYFRINTTSGEIFTRGSGPDHEEQAFVLVTIQAASGMPPTYDDVQVNITVTDINDNNPRFMARTVHTSIPENTQIGTPIYVATATDRDSGDNGLVRYELASNPGNTFGINAETGEIRLIKEVSFNDQLSFELEIRAYDAGTPPLKGNLTLTVIILDVNDNGPVFTQSFYPVSILENKPISTPVVQVEATDNDRGANALITYTLTPNDDSPYFAVFPREGWLYTRQVLDRELKSVFILNIMASDGGNPPQNSSATVQVTVVDANDNAPHFTKSSYHFHINENQPAGTEVDQVEAVDPDQGANGQVYYSLTPSGDFTIDDEGVIRTTRPLNREAAYSYRLTIRAVDGGNPVLSSSATVYINVNDLNDNSPVFSQDRTYLASVKEEQPAGEFVAWIIASDADSGVLGNISYSLINSSPKFVIDSSGVISTAASIDREDMDYYTLTVLAQDGGNPPMQATASVRVRVLDLNDNVPIAAMSAYIFTADENIHPPTVVGVVSASDMDVGDNGKIYYYITEGNDFDVWEVNHNTGEVYNVRVVDYEMAAHYSLTIMAQDNSIPQTHSTSIDVTINIIDQNDNTPDFDQNLIYLTLQENVGINHVLWTVSATDADSGPNGLIRYSILTDQDFFAIDEYTGTLRTIQNVDREINHVFLLVVQAQDQAVNVSARRAATSTVEIRIYDSNDNDPVFVSRTSTDVNEDEPIGFNVIHIIATDEDSGENGRVGYRIISGNEDGKFSLDSVTGLLTIAHSLDHEHKRDYELDILATDHGTVQRTATQTLSIRVIDVNDQPPRFEQSIYTMNVSESQGPGTYVGTVVATDLDSGINGKITYELPEEIARGLFTINSTTGEIRTISILDREQKDSYVVTVYAMDGAFPARYDMATVLIFVMDINDNNPVFAPPTFDITLPENQSPGVIHNAIATDADEGPNGDLIYEITGGDPNNAFSIGQSTGALSTLRALDREDLAMYTLVITARDQGTSPRSGTTTIRVTVTDLNDNDPVFDTMSYYKSIPENTAINSSILTVVADDADEGLNGDVYYTIDNTTVGLFTIDPEEGEIMTTGKFDYEKETRYTFQVTATDSGIFGPRSERVQVTIEISDVNDNAPVFKTIPIRANVTQNASPNTFVANVEADDKDSGNNGEVNYRFAQQSSSFAIDTVTGVITTKTLNLGILFYHLEVLAYDLGSPSLASNGIVEVWVGTSGSGGLEFSQPTYVVQPSEAADNGNVVLSLQAFLPDGGRSDDISYSLVSGNENGAFGIQVQSGGNAILVVADTTKLDYETQPNIRLVVEAMRTPENSSPMYGYTTVMVGLTDANDNAPQFVQDRYQSRVWEVPNSDIYVTQVSATDADEGTNGAIYYEITNGNTDNAFAIDQVTGIVTTAKSLDYEIEDTYILTVIARDGGSPQLTGTATMRIGIVDVNDNRPVFVSMDPVSVSEDLGVGLSVTTVMATDSDTNPNIQYSFTPDGNPGGYFAVDQYSGIITLAHSLDRETQDRYMLELEATDTEYTTTTTLEIIVTDENDNAPVFRQESYQVTLPELTQPNVAVVAVNASDKDIGDNAALTYSFVEDHQSFYIDPITGVIFTDQVIEFNNVETTIQLYVTATDSGTPALAEFVTVRIEITDVNNNSPQFGEDIYSAIVSENVSLGHHVITVVAVDLDLSPENSQISYFIESGNDQGKFQINANDGRITVLEKLDREATDSYTLIVGAVDSGEPKNNATAEVVIEVEDVNDHAPIFDHVQYEGKIAENATVDTYILTVHASDRDIGYNGEVEYSIVSGTYSDLFAIDVTSGAVSVRGELDREEVETVEFTVQASDRGMEDQLASVVLVTITITDFNEFPPYFPQLFYHYVVPENMPVETYVFTAVALDNDAGEYGELTYSIRGLGSSNGDDFFTIDRVTGEVFTSAVFDYEATNSYRFVVQAQDSGGLSISIQTEVNITSMDEFPPVFNDQEYNFEIGDGVNTGDYVGQVTATDADGGEDGMVIYSLVHEFFYIEASTGIIRVSKPLNSSARKRRGLEDRFLHRSRREIDLSAQNNFALLITASTGKPGSLTERTTAAVSVVNAASPIPVWVIAIVVVAILIILVFVVIGIVLVCRQRRRRHKKEAQADKRSVTGSMSPRSYDVTFDPVEMGAQGMVNHGMNSSGHFPHRQLYGIPGSGGGMGHTNISEPSNSASSGRGSTTMEDEEIRRINEGGVGAPKNSVREKVIDSGIAQDHEDGSVSDINSPREKHLNYLNSTSVESMHVFGEEGGGEAGGGIDIGHLIYHRLDEVGAEEDDAIMDGTRLFGFTEDGHPSMAGSLSSIVNSDEELSGSYNWDYLLDWGPQFQPLAHVFAEIAKLKDDTVAKRQTADPRLQQKKSLHANVKNYPPPLLTNTPQGPIKPVAQRVLNNTSMSNHSQHLPRSPVVQESAFVPAVVSPDLSPSLSPLAPGSPSLSPLVTSTGVSSQNSRVTSGTTTPQRMHYGGGIVFTHPTANDEEIQI
ncbi:protocadherin-23-like [Lytechinus variegatus]|uniref:protocadherin-23-like n=1 Tax=Lytechinus variegatus TaxID=7654 RepID=UPI001BB16B6B|nr:protocadherin-23-like [Lytechinus variegatus]